MRTWIKTLAALALFPLAGCTTALGTDPPVGVHFPSPEVVVGARDLGIPQGHMPPPGACRAWYPGLPPGQQPPPGSCYAPVPAGAVLVRGN